jgi:hypothetical protein
MYIPLDMQSFNSVFLQIIFPFSNDFVFTWHIEKCWLLGPGSVKTTLTFWASHWLTSRTISLTIGAAMENHILLWLAHLIASMTKRW